MKKILIFMVKAYQKTPLHTHSYCKYNPTCSSYMIISLNNYGVFKGLLLGTKRILKCNPFSKGGYDPVPIKEKK